MATFNVDPGVARARSLSVQPVDRTTLPKARPKLIAACALALTLIAVIRIVTTYPVFSQTWDEPSTISCGMEWLDHGTYDRDAKHPPLARVLAALPLYLSGARSTAFPSQYDDGNALLNWGGHYWRNLAQARAALLPFFLLACFIVWRWTTWAFGGLAGLLALGLFTCIPTVLGHAAVAMTDFPLLATLSAALYCLCLWLQRPTLQRAAVLGLAVGAAILTKLSALLFLPLCALPILLAFSSAGSLPRLRRLAKGAAVTALLTGFVIWGGYRFSTGTLLPAGQHSCQLLQSHVGGNGLLCTIATRVPLPAPALFRGAGRLWLHNQEGHENTFMGERSDQGWWYYYPVIVVAKTPPALLLLTGAGVFFGLRRFAGC
jgi:hypothetical protein